MEISIKELTEILSGKLLSGNPNTLVNNFSVNSREITEKGKNTLFVPIMGEKVDGHLFIEKAVLAGANSFFIEESHTLPQNIGEAAAISVTDTLDALRQTATYYRNKFNIPLIGITGSVGKTSTKEMVATALSSELNTYRTKGNANSQIGVPLTLFGLSEENQIAVIEMGISEFNEMAKLSSVARVNHALITNIGSAHIGNLGSKENILKEKLHITDYFNDDSVLFINLDDPLLASLLKENRYLIPNVKRIVTFGTTAHADFSASSISVSPKGTDFCLNYGDDLAEHISLKTIGMHNVRNALAALAISLEFGISIETAKSFLLNYEPVKMRGNIIKENCITLIDDTYNASPDSMISSIDTILAMRGGREPIKRRIAVLADILELGDDSKKEHFRVGSHILSANKNDPEHRIDFLITVGEDSKNIAYGATSEILSTNPTTKHFQTNSMAISYLKNLIKPYDAVLVKGSRGMYTEEIISSLINTL